METEINNTSRNGHSRFSFWPSVGEGQHCASHSGVDLNLLCCCDTCFVRARGFLVLGCMLPLACAAGEAWRPVHPLVLCLRGRVSSHPPSFRSGSSICFTSARGPGPALTSPMQYTWWLNFLVYTRQCGEGVTHQPLCTIPW